MHAPLTRSAYRSVLSVCSQLQLLGLTFAIITVRAFLPAQHGNMQQWERRIDCGSGTRLAYLGRQSIQWRHLALVHDLHSTAHQ